MTEIIIPFIFFATLFGIIYLFVSTRNRERMAMIDKGVEASSIYRNGEGNKNRYKTIILNLAMTLMGVGLGITVAILLYSQTQEEAVYPACIFFFAGLGLLSGFLIGRKLLDK